MSTDNGDSFDLGEDWADSFSDYAPSIDLRSHMHGGQLAVRHDTSWIRAVIGTRRSGKTEGFCCEAIEIADQFPGATIPYILPTIGMGRDIIFPKMEELDQRFKLGLKINRGEYKISTPSGGIIQLFGLATTPECEKGRGKKFPLVIIDEAGAQVQKLLKRAVTQTFGPATADFRGIGGRGLLIGGTPGYEPGCYWEDLCGGNSHVSKLSASVHFFTIWDNPFFKGRENIVIDGHLAEHKMTRADAAFRREWMGEFCTDTQGLCYQRWNGLLLPRHAIPKGGYTVLGLDLGHVHPCAWVVVRFNIIETLAGTVMRTIHHGHIIGSYEESGCSMEKIVAITRGIQKAYDVSVMCGDTAGSMAPTVIEDMRKVYNLPITAVKKGDLARSKASRIWMTDSQLGAGTLHVFEGADSVTRQLKSVPWNDARTDHHPSFADHSLDALHGAITLSRQHEIEHQLPPVPGTKEWFKQQHDEDVHRTIAANEAEENGFTLMN